MSENATWNDLLPVAQIRIARAVTDLARTRHFYGDGLGLQEITSFENHQGYSGVIYGLPGKAHHLEFTENTNVEGRPVPDPDDLLVLYLPDREAIGRLVVRLGAMGFHAVAPDNPYWENISVTIPDPDGWRVVLVESEGFA